MSVLSEALEGDGIHVIDLPVDYSMNHAILYKLRKGSESMA